MAKLKLLAQAITAATHSVELIQVLGLPTPTKVVISVAFVRSAGVGAIEKSLRPLVGCTDFYVGIRNDISSIQAVKLLLDWGAKVFAVDTGSRKVIFHPKLYLAVNSTQARAVIGSANLTFNGLHNNIEVSTVITMSLQDSDDDRFVKDTLATFSKLPASHPDHVFRIKTLAQANQLFEEGRLVDERTTFAPTGRASIRATERDELGPMVLSKVLLPRSDKKASARKIQPPQKKNKNSKAAGSASSNFYMVWESKPLSERDLNIPKNAGKGTNPTGSMGWKQGQYEDIDHRHYFRDEVFGDLTWYKEKHPKTIERSSANFQLIIKNVDFGIHELKLSHNFDTSTRSYAQGNMTTQLHWGDAKALIAKRDLLHRNLTLYRRDTMPPEYLIEID
jgi:HKD family nuclease